MATDPSRRPLSLKGSVVVPHSRETATRHLVGACVSGALGPGLRIVHRDAEVISFRAATLGARLFGPGRGTLTVSRDRAETRVAYALSVAGTVATAGLLGLAAGAACVLGLRGDASAPGVPVLVGAGVVVALVVAGAVAATATHRVRVRFETLLHNLRYLS